MQLATFPARRLVVASALVSALSIASVASADQAPTPPASGTTGAPGTPKAQGKPAAAPTTSTTTSTTTATTETKKEEPKKEEEAADDGKRKPHAVTLNLELGLTRSDLGAFSDSLGFDKTGANGLQYGVGAGVRLGDIRLGARFRSYSTTEFTLWSVMAEVGYGIKLEPIEPIISLHLGYAWNQEIERAVISGSLPPGNLIEPEVDLHSFLAGVEVNGLYSINQTVKVGPYLGFDLLVIKRDQANLPQSVFPGQSIAAYEVKPLYTDSGSGLGYNLSLGIRGVLDIGF